MWVSIVFKLPPKTRLLAVIGLPHRNVVARRAPLGPDYDHQPTAEMTYRHREGFSTAKAIVGQIKRSTSDDPGGVLEIKAALA
jgi:hypothetical protein